MCSFVCHTIENCTYTHMPTDVNRTSDAFNFETRKEPGIDKFGHIASQAKF